MPPHFLEHHHADAARRLVDLLQPGAEPQPDHPAALEPAGAELLDAAGDGAVAVANGPAGALTEIEGEDDRRLRRRGGNRERRARFRIGRVSQASAKRSTIVGLVAVGCLTATILPALISTASAMFRRLLSANWVRRMTSVLVRPAPPAFPMIVSRRLSSGCCDISDAEIISSADITAGSAMGAEQRIDFSFISSSRVMERRGRRRCPVRDGNPAPALEGGCGQRKWGSACVRTGGRCLKVSQDPARPLRARNPTL